VDGRDRVGLAFAQSVEAVAFGVVGRVVQLVDGEDDLRLRAAQLAGDGGVGLRGPRRASVRWSITSASSTATLAWRVTRASRPTLALGSIPPVSTRSNSAPAHSALL
jgi:hypothetical protein